ncbi:hypothetical protein METUNv1_02563 [Methyloversatilis universalis FAM5]|uniref:Uncharacterized protein n=1 Tax=Methyloversatilis universalis (strain ATCC BAA-1314 / DSM 25237 / JCM 13912 / CCUG 52030 / FAM5) TaxID=1000565 RepID=F5RE45_METUF|nr:hypothetical protein METUNv1_02563 [Methyloversatilis universalis FAM5]
MNRATATTAGHGAPVPRMRGDEPDQEDDYIDAAAPFPACAGMNRRCRCCWLLTAPVPRMRGDEPRVAGEEEVARLRSPHARG